MRQECSTTHSTCLILKISLVSEITWLRRSLKLTMMTTAPNCSWKRTTLPCSTTTKTNTIETWIKKTGGSLCATIKEAEKGTSHKGISLSTRRKARMGIKITLTKMVFRSCLDLKEVEVTNMVIVKTNLPLASRAYRILTVKSMKLNNWTKKITQWRKKMTIRREKGRIK